jgi:RimJ/RimL family protein N-acetyltransferase
MTRLRLRSPDDGDNGAREVTAWDVGWWIVPDERGRGLASSSVGLLVTWATSAPWLEGLPLMARIEPHNAPSQSVARRVGFAHRGAYNATHDLWLLR